MSPRCGLGLRTGKDGKTFSMSWGQKRVGGTEAAAIQREMSANKALGKALFRVSGTGINHHT